MVRRTALAVALVTTALAAPVALAGNVGWSVSLGAPGIGVTVGQPAYGFGGPAVGVAIGAPYAPYYGAGYWGPPAVAYPAWRPVSRPVYAPYRYRPYYAPVVVRGPVVVAPRPVVYAPRPYAPVPYRPY